jgi:hypothetical protein
LRAELSDIEMIKIYPTVSMIARLIFVQTDGIPEATFFIRWHVDPLLGNDREISSYTTAVARKWLGSDHMGIPTDAQVTVVTATEERCFLCCPCLDVISRTAGAMSEFHYKNCLKSREAR